MEKRRFGKTDKMVSLLGFGCMRFPKNGPGERDIDEEQSLKMIDYAMENGVNYFDTAYPYHGGASESFLGRALKNYDRESYYLATKMPPWNVHENGDVERIFYEQLENCRAGYFDFYLLHNFSSKYMSKMARFGAYEFLMKRKGEGVIKSLGFSFHDTPEVLERVITDYDLDFGQIQLNYLDWTLTESGRMYDILHNAGLPVIVMEPVRGGALATLTEKPAAILKEAEPETSVASWALRYAASLPGVATVLSGMSSMEQLIDNVKTFENFAPLTSEERETLGRALVEYKAAGKIPCTSCNYCSGCPAGLNIPRLFSMYNQYQKPEDGQMFSLTYRLIEPGKRADACTKCGTCEEVCPQSIKVPEFMEKVAELAAETAGCRNKLR